MYGKDRMPNAIVCDIPNSPYQNTRASSHDVSDVYQPFLKMSSGWVRLCRADDLSLVKSPGSTTGEINVNRMTFASYNYVFLEKLQNLSYLNIYKRVLKLLGFWCEEVNWFPYHRICMLKVSTTMWNNVVSIQYYFNHWYLWC